MTVINSNRAVRGPVTAIPLVAGKGVKITADTVNNRWVVEADETVLWEGNGTSGTTMNLTETAKNFATIKIYGHDSNRGRSCINEFNPAVADATDRLTFCLNMPDIATDATWWGAYNSILSYTSTACTSITNNGGFQWFTWVSNKSTETQTSRYVIVDKIVGINRIASN